MNKTNSGERRREKRGFGEELINTECKDCKDTMLDVDNRPGRSYMQASIYSITMKSYNM